MDEKSGAALIASAGSKATYTGAGTAVWGWATSSEFLGVAGLVIAVLGFLLNWYYKAKADRRNEALTRARIDSIVRTGKSDTDLAPLGEDD